MMPQSKEIQRIEKEVEMSMSYLKSLMCIKFILKKILFSIATLFTFVSIQAQTVFDRIVISPDHNTLEAAIIAADLDGALSGDGPFTVFAPTDAAFNALIQLLAS